MRRGIALVIALATLAPPTYASDLGAGMPGFKTCPPPPESCAGMRTVFSLAAAASLVFLYALSKNRD